MDLSMISLKSPYDRKEIKQLMVGDIVSLSGTLITGRDAVCKYLFEGNPSPLDLNAQIMYHAGPVVIKNERGEYVVKAAGPTTSIREEPYQSDIIKKHGLVAVIGKGGMGEKTLQAFKEMGAVYLHAIGGAAQVYSERIKKVKSVHLLEFGSPEAMWELVIEDFPVIVTMDSHGNSLHKDLEQSSENMLKKIIGIPGDKK
jgi:fumarate hydratase, class I